MKNTLYEIIENKKIIQPYYSLILKNFPDSLPGQFVNILCQRDDTFLLRRPFCINKIEKNNIRIVYKVIGRATKLLAKRQVGEIIDVIGPLGNTWQVNQNKINVLIGGGVGIAPLLYLNQFLAKNKQKTIVLLAGKSEKDLICLADFVKLKSEIYCATNDGSFGLKGHVLNLLSHILLKFKHNYQDLQLYACGSKQMLKALAKNLKTTDINCQVSLEAVMGCGMGGCVCCVCKTKDGFKKVCTEGPVFDYKAIDWASY